MKNISLMKVIIVDIAPKETPKEDLDYRMIELESLVSTYGGITVVKRVQKRDTPDYSTYVGSGKLDELVGLGAELDADLLVVGNIMKPAQIYKINEKLREKKSKMKAWDRVDLILKIFALHANSPESQLQIELAAIKHMGPRIFGMGMELSRQWGGIGGVGIGETNTEIMKRHLREKQQFIHEKLKVYQKTRAEHRKNRKRSGLTTVGIVGYTNAGKSTLMNALTHKWVLAEDKLFATLGTSVGKMYVAPKPLNESNPVDTILNEGNEPLKTSTENDFSYQPGREILINDTIGFIRDLPPDLIAAFSSTLEDSIESDLLLHVIDAGDLRIADKRAIVEETLEKIGAKQKRLLVFNKIDGISPENLMELRLSFAHEDVMFVSAVSGEWIDALKQKIAEMV